MDIKYLLSFKLHPELQNLDKELNINKQNIIKYDTYLNKKKPGIYINKVSLKKDTIINKVNLILNKLSEINFNNIILEFLETINQMTNDDYEEFQETIYKKILSEINFINLYIKFLEIINYLYNTIQNFNLEFIINCVELKFKFDYLDEDILETKYLFLKNLSGENNRLNNLKLIKNLIDYNLLSSEIIIFCENNLFIQNKYLSDIYYWNPKINNDNIIKLNNILKNEDLNIRDKVLLNNLLNNKLIIDTIIEDYIIYNNIEPITNYINNNCIDNISKTTVCKKIIEYYIKNNNDNLILLINNLISNKIILKLDVNNSIKLIKNITENIIVKFKFDN